MSETGSESDQASINSANCQFTEIPLSVGILQARILEWVAIPSSRRPSQPRDQTQVPHTAGGFFTIWGTRKAHEYWSGYPIPGSSWPRYWTMFSCIVSRFFLPAELPRKTVVLLLVLFFWRTLTNTNTKKIIQESNLQEKNEVMFKKKTQQ